MRLAQIVMIISGMALLGLSHYIQGEVLKGREQISDAQGKVNTGKKLFSLSPATKSAGDKATGFVQKKIDEGKEEADSYEALASKLQMGGVLLILGGLGLVAADFFRNKRAK